MNRLHPIAQAVQSQGRGNDTQLVHMTPNEVAGMQALAKAHGGSLSINPSTGLPEAGFLDSLLPTILGAGLTVATGGAAAPWMIGAGLGALQYARTGSLEKGLMAGLGAYGGAGLGASLAGAGATAGSQTMTNLAAEQAKQQAAAAAAKDVAAKEAAQLAAKTAGENLALQQANTLGANTFSQNLSNMGAGLKTAFTSPSTFMTQFGGSGKDLAMSAGAAAAPTVLEMMQPKTTTPPVDNEQFQYDYAPGRVSEADLAAQRAANPYGELTYFRPKYGPRQTVRVAQGGILGYADGGTSDYEYDPVTKTYKKKAAGPVGAVAPVGVEGSGSSGGDRPVELTEEQKRFFEYEMPDERDARMEKIGGLLGMLAPGSLARAAIGGLNNLTGGGVGQTPAPVFSVNVGGDRSGVVSSGASAADNMGGSVTQYSEAPSQTAANQAAAEAGGYPTLAQGGIAGLAAGGMSKGGFVVPADVVSALGNGSTDAGLRALQSKLGKIKPIKGAGDGLSDSIPTSIDGKQPARVADGEAYIDPSTVAKIGNGDMKKGAKKLYAMMARIRDQAHGKKTQQRKVSPSTII